MNRRTLLFSILGLCFKPFDTRLKGGDMVHIICEGPYSKQLNNFEKKPYRLLCVKPFSKYKYQNSKVQEIYGNEDVAVLQMDKFLFHMPISLVKRV